MRLVDDRLNDGLVQRWLIILESGRVIEAVGATEFGAIGNAFLAGQFVLPDKAFAVTALSERYRKGSQ